ncbi:MAG: hypothetical protein ACI9J3_003242, partial [Parvicellaceae bacterium]
MKLFNTKRQFRLLLICLIFICGINEVNAQCPKASAGHTFDITSLTVGVRTQASAVVWGGEYVQLQNAIPGATYTIDLCDNAGSGNASQNTFLTCFEAGNTNVLAFNDDFCGDDAQVTFVQPAGITGIDAQVSMNGCGSYATNNNMWITLDNAPVTCTDPTTPSITPTASTICPGSTTTLTISGTLNDATAWHVYTGSCGGTQIGTSATNSFVVSPSSTTTYYIRGEGGCVTAGSCGSRAVTVNSLDNASFSYSTSAYCLYASDPTPTITGLGGGTFSSTGGLSINA